MSYDFYIHQPACECCGQGGSSNHIGNYTSNMSPAWRAAGIDFLELQGEKCSVVAAKLEPVIRTMFDNRSDYAERFNPSNGWGSMTTLLPFLVRMHALLLEEPDGEFSVSA